jgi:hypothetical protein
MAESEKVATWRAPYVSHETLVNFIEKKLGSNPLPPRVDRGFLDNYAGSVQPLLLGTLRTVGLINDEGVVLDPLREAAKDPDERRRVLKAWAEEFYAEQIQLARQNATAQQLLETFSRHGYSGSTLRKAIVFYLALSDDLDLPKSPHFKPPRQQPLAGGGNNGGGPRKGRRAKPSTPPSPPAVNEAAGHAQHAERKTVSFGHAGSVTVEVNVRWLDLPEEVFLGLRKVVDDLAQLEATVKGASSDHESLGADGRASVGEGE